MDGPDILHIGYHKTATTWLQAEVFARLQGARVLGGDVARRAFLSDGSFSFRPERAREILGAGQGRIILSHEGLAGHYINGGMMGAFSRDIAGRLHATLPEAHVLVVIREQRDMITSSYLQYVRMGGSLSARALFRPERHDRQFRKHPVKCAAFLRDHFAYDGLLGHYRRLFGAERVHVFLYEALREDPEGFLAALCRELSLDPGRVPPAPRRRNLGYGARVLAAARLANLLTRDSLDGRSPGLPLLPGKGLKRVFDGINRVPWLSGPRVTPDRLLGRGFCAELAAHYAPHNAELAAMFDLPLGRHGYALPAPVADASVA